MGKYAVTGSGQVGQVLADGLLEHGHEVMRASREPSKLAEWQRPATGGSTWRPGSSRRSLAWATPS